MIMHKLLAADGSDLHPGAMLHMLNGASAGPVWRYEHIAVHEHCEHHVHVTRSHPKFGRIHREYHPRVFGCTITLDITWRRRACNAVHHVWSRIDDYFMAGAVALVPLALYERYDWGAAISTIITAGH
jgi:hypothetical protein